MPEIFQAAKFCAGCGHPLVLITLQKVLQDMNITNKAVLGLDIGCSLLAINYLPINTFHTHHGRVTPTMMGFKRGNKESLCFGYTGDGGAYAIGLQSLLHSAHRDEPITVLVINNAVYAMTGGQKAPTTIPGQKIDIGINQDRPFFGAEIVKKVAQEGSYIARGAVTDINGLREMIKKAILAQQAGHFSLVEALAFCPTNWRTTGKATFDYLENLKTVYKTGEL